MQDIFDYLAWRGDLGFAQDGINNVDTVILSRIAYIPLDDIVRGIGAGSMRLGDALDAFMDLPDAYNRVVMAADISLCLELIDCPRFADLTVSCYENMIDNDRVLQFSAMVLSIADDLHFVAFRGTDNTLVGWKEDYNMTITAPVPAQIESVRYLNAVANVLDGRLILGGHSKGGNLAIYSASYVDEAVQERILEIYSHDAPGFLSVVTQSEGYVRILDKIRSFVPQCSVVGMMLEHSEEFTIVRSVQRVFWQHDIYSWVVQGPNFECLDTVTAGSRFLDKTLKDWLVNMETEAREEVIECIFELICDANAETLRDLAADKVHTAKIIIKSAVGLDEQRRNNVLHSLGTLVRAAKDNISEVFPQK